MNPHNLFNTLQTFSLGAGQNGKFYSLPQLEKEGVGKISRLPVCIRIVLESVLRNCDGKKITEENIRALANWQANAERTEEIPFIVARIVLQDFTGVPLLVDLAAMRSAAGLLGKNPDIIEPLVPVDLVVDHSVQVDFYNRVNAMDLNIKMEFKRNQARYQFLKWGMQAFNGFKVVPPGIGIVHQVNLEYLAKGVLSKDDIYYPDTLVGTDSHTTMINGIGVVGWGVGGIEAEAGMLGQPVYILVPDVVGVHMTGSLREGVTATDLVLHTTEMLRKAKVVGKFVEFHGEGAATLSAPDRATIANMAPEYGATMGFFPIDEETCAYFKATGRTDEQISAFRNYFKAQGMFGIPRRGACDYTAVLELDLTQVTPSVSGPKRPQDRISLPQLKNKFIDLLQKPTTENGYGKSTAQLIERFPFVLGSGSEQNLEPTLGIAQKKPPSAPEMKSEMEMVANRPTPDVVQEAMEEFPNLATDLGHGDVVIAAITSCTNTSNPSVMLAAGLLAKKAVEKGLKINPRVKTSLAPGSRAVTEYLQNAGLQQYFDKIGFRLVGYGCTTCIGNSGPLDANMEEAITGNDVVAASVLSGNRNFEARVHPNVKANFLMSPPLVVAFALAGRVDIDLTSEPLSIGKDKQPVYLKDIWPSMKEIAQCMRFAMEPDTYRNLYRNFAEQNPLWNAIAAPTGAVYEWDPTSTYIQEPPFFTGFKMKPGKVSDIKGARPLAIFGDSVTTDHISPAGSIKPSSPAGKYLIEMGVGVLEFNSYGARRGNDRVMVRGTFANVRIRNLMVPGVEGGVTVHYPDRQQTSIYDAAMKYREEKVPLMVIAGEEYGTGSSRDWAAKGTALLGVKAVIAASFERIHRSNLVGMGVLPCQFKEGVNAKSLKLDGSEVFDLIGVEKQLKPQQDVTWIIHRSDGRVEKVPLTLRIDTPVEVDYYRHGGILPYVLRELIAHAPN
jgi:aconitate hydratase